MPDSAGSVLPVDQLNNFTYVNTANPAQDDTLGLKCPIGSHIRRNNPRNAAVVGTDSTHHRIVRRAMPYGPPYDPARPDAPPRGLVGFFINASISNQFEFLTSQWNDRSDFVKSAMGPGGSSAGNAVYNISGEDVFLGVNDPPHSSFTLAAPGAKGANNTVLKGFTRTITTRGGVFFPKHLRAALSRRSGRWRGGRRIGTAASGCRAYQRCSAVAHWRRCPYRPC